jgi:2-polyprenyl-6-methoxyphenol hydroxylase-like FAD-dependent oxidoreductase
MAIEDSFELVKQITTVQAAETVPSLLRQFEASRRDRIRRVFTTSRQVGWLGQAEQPIVCFARNWIYRLTPTWLADLQFKWLFDYAPQSITSGGVFSEAQSDRKAENES